MANNQKRQTAYKVQIQDLIEGDFVTEEGWNPNYVIDKYGRKISRVNLISAVVDIPDSENTFNYYSIVIDDSTGKISARLFENYERLKAFNVGDIVSIIGRIREYGTERYIILEIIRKIDNPKWIEVRQREIELLKSTLQQVDSNQQPEPVHDKIKSDSKETSMTAENKEVADEGINDLNASESVLALIRELDKGEGVDTDEVIKKSKIDSCEELIKSLLLEGDMFEVRPGRLKVLD
ncbi:MAG: hypothetical protein KAS15_03730 [Nanoarchaeota archaeon]|nr:hypothetical protein [Nanoarchaeota archaeon]MCK5629508.1 hypothetical protein [Nanoarchaeota archaeon]